MELTLDTIRDIKLYQRKSGYRFSLDALLLYDFIKQPMASRIADLGAGSGIIGILLGKKYQKAKVYLLELQESLYELALKNIGINGLTDRVEAIRADIKEIKKSKHLFSFKGGSFDLVVSNPPFRKPLTGRISLEEERAVARHEIGMGLADLAKAASYLLKNRGRFYLVYLPERLPYAFDVLRGESLEPKRIRFAHGKIALPAKMALLECVKGGSPALLVQEPLIVYDDKGIYTEEISNIYKSPS
jgi:tRNA1Val (adenine37-N6)-methyltransferase